MSAPDVGGLSLDEARTVAQAAPSGFDLDAIRARVDRSRRAANLGRRSKVYRVFTDRAELLAEVDRLRAELAARGAT